jgi:hypothetical protein
MSRSPGAKATTFDEAWTKPSRSPIPARVTRVGCCAFRLQGVEPLFDEHRKAERARGEAGEDVVALPGLRRYRKGSSRRAHTTRLGVGEVDSMWPAWVVERLDDRVVLLVVDDRDACARALERREREVSVR